MADPTPAAELRAAAAKVRRDADAARSFVPEPWTITCERVIRAANDDIVADRSACRPGDDADLPYIAAMHPGVGALLADWLESTAATIEAVTRKHEDAAPESSHWVAPALAVARAINGGPR